jgi:hypothetical protein
MRILVGIPHEHDLAGEVLLLRMCDAQTAS